jgi:NhaA family Na+:H+ antiporter
VVEIGEWPTGSGVFGCVHLTESLRDWVNDGLIAIFIFVGGLEVKRELVAGEVASPHRAVLPAAAAGGVDLPSGVRPQ